MCTVVGRIFLPVAFRVVLEPSGCLYLQWACLLRTERQLGMGPYTMTRLLAVQPITLREGWMNGFHFVAVYPTPLTNVKR